MNYIAWGLLLIEFVVDVLLLLGLYFADDHIVKSIQQGNRNISYKKKYTIHIFIALFNESKGIENTLKWFSKFLSPNVQLVFITTEKETRVFGDNKTLRRIQNLLSLPCYSSLPITVVNYPMETGNKGAQLNYALRQLDKLRSDDYILVYDADSRPDLKSLGELSNIIQIKGPNVIQQSSLYLENYNVSSPYMKVEALFESIRAMGIERRNYILKKGGLSPFCYCVGHGMCFRVSFLRRVALFPEPNEDVPMGVKVALSGEDIEPMVAKDYCRVTNSVKMLFFQSGNWIKAPFVCMKTFFTFQKHSTTNIYHRAILFLEILFDFFSWIAPLILAVVAILSLCASFKSLYFFLSWLLVKTVLPELQVLAFRKKYANVQITYKEFLLAPWRELFRGLALISLALQVIGISYNEMGRGND